MIRLPEDGWGAAAPADQFGRDDAPVAALLTGEAATLPVGTFTVPSEPHLLAQPAAADDPVAEADALRDRAAAVFQRQRATSAFNRDLDALFSTIAEGSEWSDGLSRYEDGLARIRQQHEQNLSEPEDRAAFARHAEQFGIMQRIGLKRALAERQHAEALAQLDEQLAYYADKAAAAPNEVFRSLAVDTGLQAIDELRDAGYLFPESAARLADAFRRRLDNADLEAIVAADPAGAASMLDDTRLFRNADRTARDGLRMRSASLVTGVASDAVPGIGEALRYVTGELGRIGDHPENVRKDPVLGVSVGAGEMPSDEPKRPWGPLPMEKDDDEGARYSPDKPGWHHYVVGPVAIGTVAEGMTEELAKDALRRFAVPGQDPARGVEHDKIYPVYIPGTRETHASVGNVRVVVGDDGKSITNIAQRGHIFYPGRITREVELRDGTWYMTTTGWGNNERAFMDKTNQVFGPPTFEAVDDAMKDYVRAQLAK